MMLMVYFIGKARWHFCFQKSITVVIHVYDLHLDGMIIKVFQERKKNSTTEKVKWQLVFEMTRN